MSKVTKSQQPPTSLIFTLDEAQTGRYYQWRQEIETRVFQHQITTGTTLQGTPLDPDMLTMLRDIAAAGEVQPYYGSIAGAYTFRFTPTSLGVAVTVRNSETGDEINLSDYDSW
jgi:hypothetical protein